MEIASKTPAVEITGLTKTFKNVIANDRIDLSIKKGSIHGLIGENGAGKSTAMKMLYGLLTPDSGQIKINGIEKKWKTPLDAIRCGIGMVHQHFMLAGPHSALENIILGAEPILLHKNFPHFINILDRKKSIKKLELLASQYGLLVDWDTSIEKQSVGTQQRIEILKLLFRDAEILILDEPTAVLTPQETEELFSNLKKLKKEGKTIIIITHKLKEVMSFTDSVTVFRGGKVTGNVCTSETSVQELANMMVGRKVILEVEVPPRIELNETILEVKNLILKSPNKKLSEKNKLSNLNFKINSGEILGIAGVEGNGQKELLQALIEPHRLSQNLEGEISYFGKCVNSFSTRKIRDLGIGLIPEDRQKQGLLMEASMQENFILGIQDIPEFQKLGVLLNSKIKNSAQTAVNEYQIRPTNLDSQVQQLSGGNQQKLIVAREFHRKPKILLASQPTRGVDVGAIEFIHKKILSARSQGSGVLLISSELDEIMALSDRILVMYEGKIVAQFSRDEREPSPKKYDETQIGLFMGGAGGAGVVRVRNDL